MLRPTRHATALLIASGLALAACAPTTRVHGFVPSEADVSRITPGVDTSETVRQIFGQPASSGLLRDGTWYYVQSTMQQFAFNAPRVVDRTVLAVTFDPEGRVAGIDRFGIAEGRVVNLTSRTTDTGGRQMGVLEQLFGNLLNIDAGALAEGQ